MKSSNRKKVLFILGMHRSGTSALAGSIHLSGISGGQELLAPSFDNEKGFFENRAAFKINEDILGELGLSWDSPFDLPDGWVSDGRLQKHKQAIAHFLSAELMNSPALYVKDPRLSFLLPVWLEVLKELELDAACVVTIRHPEEVYHSLRRRNDLSRNNALSLWLDHMLSAEKNTRDLPRRFVSYSSLLENPAGIVEALLQDFELLPDETVWQSCRKNISNFIDKKLKHHDLPKAVPGKEILPYYAPIFDLLQTLVKSPSDLSAMSELDRLRNLYQFNLQFFTPETKKEFFATLKLECGSQTRMVAPMKLPVYEGLERVVFNTSHVTVPIEQAMFFPCDELCHATVSHIRISYDDGNLETCEAVEKKVLIEHGIEFLFDRQNYLVIEPKPGKKVVSIAIDIRYESIGEAALASVGDFGAKIRNWFFESLEEQSTGFEREKEILQQQLQTEESRAAELVEKMETAEKEFTEQRNAQAATIGQLESRLELTLNDLQDWTAQAAAWQVKTEEVSRNLEESKGELEETRQELTTAGKELEAAKRELETTREELQSSKQETESEHRKAELTKRELDAANREIAAGRSTLKKKDDLIWELYSKNQKLENDYRQALRTLEETRSAFSNKLGRTLTAPFRFAYDLFSKKPFNETGLWLFLQFLGSGLKMPGRMLSQINSKNIGTLRKALKNESPREIAGNLKKLLLGRSGAAQVSSGNGVTRQPVEIGRDDAAEISLPFANGSGKRQPVTTDVEINSLVHRKKVVLFASPNLPDFDASSGGRRATRLLELLAEECEVYAFTLGNKPEKHIRKLEEVGVRVFRSGDFQEVKKVAPKVDVLIFSFFYTYFDCGEFLKLFPNAKLVVDTVDVHWVRHERSIGLWEELTEEVVRKKKALEIEVYRKAEVIWAVTQFDKQAILAEVPEADVHIISNVHTIEVSEWKDPGNNNLLFFGGFAHYPNIIAVKELVFRIFPKIREQVPDAKLLIAGANAPPEVEDLGKLPGVEFVGFVNEDELKNLYRNTFLALVPLQTGAGIKGKICEAIAYGVPVVTNRIGNEGIELVNEESGLISNEKEELVRLTVKALRREYDFNDMVAGAQKRLENLVGPAVVKKNMMDSLDHPGISICIVTWNKLQLLQRCIESIENHTHYPNYQILIYSNGCTDGTKGYLEAAAKINPRIVPIFSETNDVFVIPNNRMMQLFPQNDVVLLNNDTYVTKGWLEALREAAYSSPDIGISGAKLLYPDGILQEFGSELYANGTGRNIGKGDEPNKEEYSHPKYSGYVSGCAFYVKRETINKIGVFDEAFHPCYCEDSDYCYTAWEHDIATMVTPKCVIYHDEGGTSGTDTSTGFKAYQKVNFEKFLKKHSGRLDEIASKIKLKNITLASGNGAALTGKQNGTESSEKPAEKLTHALSKVAQDLDSLDFYSISNSEFEYINEAWQGVVKGIKNISHRPGDRKDLADFEKIWAAQSIQFMVELLPDIQAVLLKYYHRSSVLECVDIGAGSGSGTNLIAQLHADHVVYSKLNVTAVDYVDHRRRWAKSQYPLIDYKVANLYGMPSKSYDIVVCSNCVEHVSFPDKFIWELVRICKGFAFVYTPYNEQDMILGHINRITEELYEGFPVEQIKVMRSMAWGADIPERNMILAILDCRNNEKAS